MLLRPVLPRPPPPTTDGGLSTAGGVQQRGDTAGTADTDGSERKRVTDREEAAKIIQRSWRQHIVREYFINSSCTISDGNVKHFNKCFCRIHPQLSCPLLTIHSSAQKSIKLTAVLKIETIQLHCSYKEMIINFTCAFVCRMSKYTDITEI